MDMQLTDRELVELLEYSKDGLMISDDKGKIIYLNQTYRQLTKLRRMAKVGVYMKDLVEQEIIDGSTCLQAIETRETVVDIHPTKTSTIVVSSCPVFAPDGSIRYVVTNVHDGSDYLLLYDRIQDLSRQLVDLSQHLGENAFASKGIIAVSQRMRKCLETARRTASYDVPILITGESGTGKDVVANYIHANSSRSDRPFVSVNCGAIPENLLETELFGYAEGTFTGQVRGGKKGLLDAAEGGTLFLDEIGEMPLAMQAKLLHVLESNSYRPVGSTRLQHVNIRFIYATNRDLKQMVQDKLFREDLYYRINVLPLTVYPLRERPEDILPLALFFLDHYNKKYNLHRQICPTTLQALAEYSWPGNVRELKNAIEEMTVLSQGDYLVMSDFRHKSCTAATEAAQKEPPEAPLPKPKKPAESTDEPIGSLADFMDAQEREYLLQVYRQVGSTRRMAEALGVNHSTIIRKLKKYDIHLK